MQRRLGQVLRAERSRLGISQEELADRAGFHRTYISQLERGLKSPSIRALGSICTVLRVPVSVLIAKAEEPAR